MATRQQRRQEYGGTSEQRQRNLEGDAFKERAPQTPEELEAARADPEKDAHQIEHMDVLPRESASEEEE